jgi:hypothetical protein
MTTIAAEAVHHPVDCALAARSHSGARIAARTARNSGKAVARLSLSVMQIMAVRPLGVSTVETSNRIDSGGTELGVPEREMILARKPRRCRDSNLVVVIVIPGLGVYDIHENLNPILGSFRGADHLSCEQDSRLSARLCS